MATMYCALCRRPVEARRDIGVGTVALAVVTAGLSLLAIPFYPKRCSICKSTALSSAAIEGAADLQDGSSLKRLADLEQRLTFTEGELESAVVELDRLRAERDFYRQLLGDPSGRPKEG
jgi:hypothetical protein